MGNTFKCNFGDHKSSVLSETNIFTTGGLI